MTRINLVPPESLHSKHLLAEYRELPRIFGLVAAAQARGLTPTTAHIPPEFKLGAGHVTFFYNKLTWLELRFWKLVAECKRRGFNIQYTKMPSLADHIHPHWWNDWQPTEHAVSLSYQRILEKMPK